VSVPVSLPLPCGEDKETCRWSAIQRSSFGGLHGPRPPDGVRLSEQDVSGGRAAARDQSEHLAPPARAGDTSGGQPPHAHGRPAHARPGQNRRPAGPQAPPTVEGQAWCPLHIRYRFLIDELARLVSSSNRVNGRARRNARGRCTRASAGPGASETALHDDLVERQFTPPSPSTRPARATRTGVRERDDRPQAATP